MVKFFKRLFCKHEEKFCVTNIHGDMINHLNCRSIWECKKCGKQFKSNKLDTDCKYVNFKRKIGE
jgi:ribosomal protein L37AE/L43A